MAGIPLRDVFPKGLYARSVLLTLLPVVIILTLMTLYFYNGHLRSVNAKLSQSVAREVALIDQTCTEAPTNMTSQAFIEATLNLTFKCDISTLVTAPEATPRFFYAALVRQTIEGRLGKEVDVFLRRSDDMLEIRIPSNGEVRQVLMERKRAIAINGHIFIVWVVLFSLFMVFTALAFLRNQVRSILRLTEAAQAFGRGQDMVDYRPSGAREVRAAAHAVIQMRQRLVRFARQRTQMLAGVSHDLRTPLTRLNLQLAMLEQSEDITAARSDIAEMQAMLDEYLAFARGENGEKAQPVDLTALMSDIVAQFPDADLRVIVSPEITLLSKPVMLKRALSNIVGNAVAYAPYAEISLNAHEGWVMIRVDDNGPGIPADKYEEALRPFARLNEARTQNLPGTGLGLALARDAARSGGGRLRLDQSPLGGLRVEMVLPF